jgi:hypothetical protein
MIRGGLAVRKNGMPIPKRDKTMLINCVACQEGSKLADIDCYFPVVDALESELEGIEGQIFARRSARARIEPLYGPKDRIMLGASGEPDGCDECRQ